MNAKNTYTSFEFVDEKRKLLYQLSSLVKMKKSCILI